MARTRLFASLACLAAAALTAGAAQSARAADLVVGIDFPSGSGQVQEIDQAARLVRLVPTPHAGRGWACWWYVRVSGITPGETLSLNVGDGVWATPDRAAFSTDGGRTWRHTEPGERTGRRIVYRQRVDAAAALFAWGPPFTPADAEALVTDLAARIDGKDGVRAEAFELCKSREGRRTPALRLVPPPPAKPGGAARLRGLFVCARQHAWESGGSWVGRGLGEFLAGDDPAAAALRRGTIVYFVPVMDVDNVAVGAGGKAQDPHDHNRDWRAAPVFPAVAAAQRIILDLDRAGTFDLFLDLHNPAANNHRPFFFVREEEMLAEAGKRNLARFLTAAGEHVTGPLRLEPKPKPSGPKYDKDWRAISGNWVNEHTAPHVVAACLETSWNTPHSTTEGYQTVGRQLGRAVAAYLADPGQ